MKLMYCEDCGDIVSPYGNYKPRWCACGRHAVWWEDGAAGKLVLYDKVERRDCKGSTYDGFPMKGPRAWVLGIHNGALTEKLNPSSVSLMLIAAKGYIFQEQGSLIARFRPLGTSDTRWSYTLPGEVR